MEQNQSLIDFINRIEASHFRSNSDTGANFNALNIWNLVRLEAGLPPLTGDDLRQRQVDSSSSDLTVEDLRRFDAAQDRKRTDEFLYVQQGRARGDLPSELSYYEN